MICQPTLRGEGRANHVAVGTMIVLFASIACAMLLSAGAAAALAIARARNPFAWFAIGFALPGVGILILLWLPIEAKKGALQKRDRVATGPKAAASVEMVQATEEPAALARNGAQKRAEPGTQLNGIPVPSMDERWSMLIEYDPLLREAAEQLTPLGGDSVDKLRQAYFVLQDRSLIPGIVTRIRDKHEVKMRQAAAEAAPPQHARHSHEAPPMAVHTEHMPHDQNVASFSARPSRPVPRHTTVTPQDLESAMYLETYRGVHLYRLADGRTYVDGLMALLSPEAARDLIQQTAQPDTQPLVPAYSEPVRAVSRL